MTKKNIDYTYALKKCPLISVNPEIMGGVPCVKGEDMPLECILSSLYRNNNISGVKSDYPNLNIPQIKQAIYFAQLVLGEVTDD